MPTTPSVLPALFPDEWKEFQSIASPAEQSQHLSLADCSHAVHEGTVLFPVL